MAHPVACKAFGCTLQRPVADCTGAHAAWDPHASKLRTRDPVTGKWLDVSISGYVDDLTKLLVLPQQLKHVTAACGSPVRTWIRHWTPLEARRTQARTKWRRRSWRVTATRNNDNSSRAR